MFAVWDLLILLREPAVEIFGPAQSAASRAHQCLADDLARSLDEAHHVCLREVTAQGREGRSIEPWL